MRVAMAPWHPGSKLNRIQIMIVRIVKTTQLLIIIHTLFTVGHVDCSESFIASRQVQRTKQHQIK